MTGNVPRGPWRHFAIALAGVLLVAQAWGREVPERIPIPELSPSPARLAIIIDDLGDHWHRGMRSVALPVPVTVSVLPFTPYGTELAQRADANGLEVMLHLPMQAKSDQHPGPGALMLDMDRKQVQGTLRRALNDVPQASGVNNHMGSLLTRHPGHMLWVMEVLEDEGGLYFIDSRTSARSVAEAAAREQGLEHGRRHVFLDPQQDPEVIEEELARAVAMAREQGEAIAIGHPYPETLTILERELPRLQAQGIEFVPASELVRPARARSITER